MIGLSSPKPLRAVQDSHDSSGSSQKDRSRGAAPFEARYTEWFEGQSELRQTDRITNAELARRTIGLLKEAGEKLHQNVDQRLPPGHRMQKAVLAELLQGIPYLGSCRIGRVPIHRSGELLSIAEFYVTNFDAKLSTRAPHFYSYDENALKKGGMFYGVGVFTDRYGRRLAFDRRFGDGGIYFQTRKEAVALYAMAGLATGKSLAELKQLDRNNFHSIQPLIEAEPAEIIDIATDETREI